MNKVIVWQKPDGSIAITYPVYSTQLPGETEDDFLDRIATQAQEVGYIRKPNVQEASLPQDHEFFDQWRMPGGAVIEDATEVRNERWRRVQVERDKRLKESDSDLLNLIETAGDQTAMKAYRAAVRDVTNQPDPANINWPVKP